MSPGENVLGSMHIAAHLLLFQTLHHLPRTDGKKLTVSVHLPFPDKKSLLHSLSVFFYAYLILHNPVLRMAVCAIDALLPLKKHLPSAIFLISLLYPFLFPQRTGMMPCHILLY